MHSEGEGKQAKADVSSVHVLFRGLPPDGVCDPDRGGSSHHTRSSQENPSQACSTAWFSVDSRCSQVSSPGWASQYNTQFCFGRVWASLKSRRPACITDEQTPVPSSVATAGPPSHCLLSQSQLSVCAVHGPQFSRGPGLCQDQEHLLHRDGASEDSSSYRGCHGSSLEGEGNSSKSREECTPGP